MPEHDNWFPERLGDLKIIHIFGHFQLGKFHKEHRGIGRADSPNLDLAMFGGLD